MADSRVKLITMNLIETFNNKEFQYNNELHYSTCEMQRHIRKINNRYPFIELSGPASEVVSRGSGVSNVNLHYLIEFRDLRIDDSYKEGLIVDPVAITFANVSADLQTILEADITRGGNAENTEWGDFGYYFDLLNDGGEEFVIYQEVLVKVRLSTSNPYIGG